MPSEQYIMGALSKAGQEALERTLAGLPWWMGGDKRGEVRAGRTTTAGGEAMEHMAAVAHMNGEMRDEARRTGARMALEALAGGHAGIARREDWKEQTRAWMSSDHAGDWMEGVLEGVARHRALAGGVETVHPSRAMDLGRILLEVAGPEAWGRTDRAGYTLGARLARASMESPSNARDAVVVAEGLRLAAGGNAALRQALATAMAAPDAEGSRPLDVLRTREAGHTGQEASPGDDALAGALEGWTMMATPDGAQAWEAQAEALGAIRKAVVRAGEGPVRDLPGEPLAALEAVPRGEVRTYWALQVAEDAYRAHEGHGDGVLGGWLRQTGQQALRLAEEGGDGVGQRRMRDGANLLHRLAPWPKGYEHACRGIDLVVRGRGSQVRAMEGQRDSRGRTAARLVGESRKAAKRAERNARGRAG